MAHIRFDIFTLFPEMFEGFLNHSMIKRARENDLIETHTVNFRDFAKDKHKMVDDTPYGGGGGMVLKPEPLFDAVESVLQGVTSKPPIVLMTPQGEPYTTKKAEELSKYDRILILCGHYEGYDERIRTHLATEEISMGDYVLTGGELPAMILIDSVSRFIPGVLGNHTSAITDSFSDGLLEYPHYTRPADFRGLQVPDVLLSGHHANIEKWRRREQMKRTYLHRPDLLEAVELTEEERLFLNQLKNQG